MWTAVKAFFLGNRLALFGVLALGVVVLLSGCYVMVTRAYQSIYQAGFDAGKLHIASETKDQVIAAQAQSLTLQQQVMNTTLEYQSLFAQFQAMEAEGPKEITRYVRQDPAFYAARRPDAAHAQRVRELRALQAAAATR